MSLVALLWIFSSISMSFLRYGLHACIQYSKWGLTIGLYRGTIKLFSLYVIFLRIIPRIWLPLDAAILQCSETFMLAFIDTPKSFSFTDMSDMNSYNESTGLSFNNRIWKNDNAIAYVVCIDRFPISGGQGVSEVVMYRVKKRSCELFAKLSICRWDVLQPFVRRHREGSSYEGSRRPWWCMCSHMWYVHCMTFKSGDSNKTIRTCHCRQYFRTGVNALLSMFIPFKLSFLSIPIRCSHMWYVPIMANFSKTIKIRYCRQYRSWCDSFQAVPLN